MTINKEVELTLCQRTHKFTVDRLELYICPFNVVLYSIMVSMSSQSHNDITLAGHLDSTRNGRPRHHISDVSIRMHREYSLCDN
jgi:hypothetical protein